MVDSVVVRGVVATMVALVTFFDFMVSLPTGDTWNSKVPPYKQQSMMTYNTTQVRPLETPWFAHGEERTSSWEERRFITMDRKFLVICTPVI